MGIDTKGIIMIAEKDVFKVMKIVESTIFKMVREEKEKKGLHGLQQDDKNRFPVSELCASSRAVSCEFILRGDARRLFICFDCDQDYGFVEKGSKIIFNLGCWGESVELMRSIITELCQQLEIHGFLIPSDYEEDKFQNIGH
jgi:hypothetical protein